MPRQEDTPMFDERPTGPAADRYSREQDGESTAGPAGQTARETAATVQETAGQYAEQGRQQITSQLSNQKIRLTHSLNSISDAIHTAGERLREQDESGAAQIVDQGAQRLDSVARYLEDHDVNELIGEVESFARQRPAIFLGGAFGLGLLAARFLKSSGQQAGTTRY